MEISHAFWKVSSADLLEWLLDYHNPWKANWNDPQGHSRNDYFPHSMSCFTFKVTTWKHFQKGQLYLIDAHLFCFLICMYVLVSAKGEICGEVSPCFCWCRYLLRPNIEPDLSQFKPGSIHNANIVQFKWTNTPNIN